MAYLVIYKKMKQKNILPKKAEGKKYTYGYYVNCAQSVTTCFIYYSETPPHEIGITLYNGVGIIITVNPISSDREAYLHAIKIYANKKGIQNINIVYNEIVSLYLHYNAIPYKN